MDPINRIRPLHIRPEAQGDYRAVEEMTRNAFWRKATDEHYLVHILRSHADFIPELDFVAETKDGRLAGNIMYSKATIQTAKGVILPIITFGPLTVAPEFQRQGVGKALLAHSIQQAKQLGYCAIVFFGHPDYYPRYGFYRGAAFGITDAYGNSFDALMAMPLIDSALDNAAGYFSESPVFQMDPVKVAEFEAGFPPKDPAMEHPISLLLARLPQSACQGFLENEVQTLEALQGYSGSELLRFPGMDRECLGLVNRVLREYALPAKLFPDSPLLPWNLSGAALL